MRFKTTALSLTLVAMAFTQPLQAQAEADDLRSIERQRLRALVEADVASARRLHADDFQLVNPAGGALSREQYLGQIASGELDYLVWEPEAIEVPATATEP